ncbi:MAG: DNA polymerase III subunit gamma/tau [Clostridiales bacterium]|nr:DNA polymerase III subunit gamma/tau [Clostridiales bacterium]
MTHMALYRRFRPQVFEDVIGQDPIIITLKNQIKSNNIFHAYLFSGTRGTGKTTTARIFARAVNCLDPQDANPCNKCEVCEGILTENIIDIIEIDAASNRGIDNVRELRENVKYPPSRSKYKVYIIDEAHMLTPEAFNAFLKTLEESPKHVIFILATTNPQALPKTILSRCQRYNFKSIGTEDIIKELKNICTELDVEIEREALSIIALNAKGALRDALSILEQCISFNDNNITADDVLEVLGMVNYDILFKMAKSIADRNSVDTIYTIQEIVAQGKEIQQLIKDLINHFRSLMMIKLDVQLEDMSNLSEEILNKYREQAKLFSSERITNIIYKLSDIETRAKYSEQPRILLEVGIISLCQEDELTTLEVLADKVKALESRINGGNIHIPESEGVKKSIENIKEVLDKPIKKTEEKDDVNIVNMKNKEDIDTLEERDNLSVKENIEEKEIIKSNPLDFKKIESNWEEIRDYMKKDKKASIEALLKEGTLEEMRKDVLIISFKDGYGFHRETIDQPRNKEYIIDVIEKITGQKVKISFVMEYELGKSEENKEDTEIKEVVEKLQETVPEKLLEIIDE